MHLLLPAKACVLAPLVRAFLRYGISSGLLFPVASLGRPFLDHPSFTRPDTADPSPLLGPHGRNVWHRPHSPAGSPLQHLPCHADRLDRPDARPLPFQQPPPAPRLRDRHPRRLPRLHSRSRRNSGVSSPPKAPTKARRMSPSACPTASMPASRASAAGLRPTSSFPATDVSSSSGARDPSGFSSPPAS